MALRGGSAWIRGHPDRDRLAATAGIEGLWRRGGLLLGGSLDASSRVENLTTGSVRHLFFAGVGGTSIYLSDRVRLDLVAELGAHRLSGSRSGPFRVNADQGSDAVDVWLGSEPAWAPFMGARPSLEFLFWEFAVGLGAWTRVDLIALNPPTWLNPAPFPVEAQQYSVGRFSAGADLYLAYRFF